MEGRGFGQYGRGGCGGGRGSGRGGASKPTQSGHARRDLEYRRGGAGGGRGGVSKPTHFDHARRDQEYGRGGVGGGRGSRSGYDQAPKSSASGTGSGGGGEDAGSWSVVASPRQRKDAHVTDTAGTPRSSASYAGSSGGDDASSWSVVASRRQRKDAQVTDTAGTPRSSASDAGSGGGGDDAGSWSVVASRRQRKDAHVTDTACTPRSSASDAGSGGSDGTSSWSVVASRRQRKDAHVTDTADKFRGVALSTQRFDHGQRQAAPSTKTIQILANHFRVQFDPTMTILHYNVIISETVKFKGEANMVKEELLSAHLGGYPLAFDGQRNIYSRLALPDTPFHVQVGGDDGRPPKTFTVFLQKVNELHLSLVHEYLQGTREVAPREVLQAMDVIVKENLRRSRLLVGRYFHPKDGSAELKIGKGVVASRGLQQSLKLTEQGLILCLDYSVIPFFKPLPLMEFLQENWKISFHPKKGLSPRDRGFVAEVLKGLKVRVCHRQTNQKFVVKGLTEEVARSIAFPVCDANGVVTGKKKLVQYFKETYNRVVQYECLPCLELGTREKRNDVPMEFCVVDAWQRCSKEHLDKYQDREWKRYALAKPAERQGIICDMIKSEDGPCGGGIIQSFNISIDIDMTRVDGRVLNQPTLKVRNDVGQVCRMDPKENGQWNLFNKQVFEGTKIDTWAIVDFLYEDQQSAGLDPFISNLVQKCNRMGIKMKSTPLSKGATRMEILDEPKQLYALLHKINDQAQGRLQILICLIPNCGNGFKTLKRVSEIEVGIITQCCLRDYALVDNNDQYLANVALKINAKLGGSTAALYNDLPCLPSNKRVMFIGADVNHPKSHDFASHSIAAVVGTVNWPGASKYAARFGIQDHREEQILNLGELCLELINVYAQANGFRPETIFLFRDGVADNQFNMVLNEELVDVKRTICSDGYSPKITLIVAQKRHQTRLFPINSTGNVQGNVPTGTVVQTTIVNKDWDNFYLSSCNGLLGTSKTTHYQVLSDESKFDSGKIKEILYNLCYMFARCTKPVSLVPPVYWADVMAYRGRLYYESLVESSSQSTTSSRGSSSSPTLDAEELAGHLNLHPGIKNKMFFT